MEKFEAGAQVSYRWSDGSPHTGTIKKWGTKWVEITNSISGKVDWVAPEGVIGQVIPSGELFTEAQPEPVAEPFVEPTEEVPTPTVEVAAAVEPQPETSKPPIRIDIEQWEQKDEDDVVDDDEEDEDEELEDDDDADEDAEDEEDEDFEDEDEVEEPEAIKEAPLPPITPSYDSGVAVAVAPAKKTEHHKLAHITEKSFKRREEKVIAIAAQRTWSAIEEQVTDELGKKPNKRERIDATINSGKLFQLGGVESKCLEIGTTWGELHAKFSKMSVTGMRLMLRDAL